ncbi:MAG: hydrogenobyrinic acid a,c-diamide synthase (glutamine-hydrolyzing), partial [Gammaproteobacteria bacterium]|nr:hydrogenobyrinic acid a,c-diamide synthase (glutamine-hydrolyzing) [Gammaproteobacteria bacterium]
MNRLLISAAHKSSGKTTLSIGLCAALTRRGIRVQPFKKGPDYIDPMWLGLASRQPCYNLDFFLTPPQEIRRDFIARSEGAGIALIEGNKGLYDGLDLDGSNSNAALAKLLGAPVILVIDARGMTRGVAPLILGYQAFDRDIRVAGVILNQLGGARHERKLRAVIEHYTDVPVIGAVHHNDNLSIVERHLGLVPSNEASAAREKIDSIASAIEDQLDLQRLIDISASAEPLGPEPILPALMTGGKKERPIRIGVARDAAFAFYYPSDLEALEGHGAELVFFNTLRDERLPDVDALFIGGGFPETQMTALESNVAMRRQIHAAIEAGMPVYAECGGLMYLSRSLTWNGKTCAMVGSIPADTRMHARPQGRGYVILTESGQSPWPSLAHTGSAVEIRAHEFHYSRLENVDSSLHYAYRVVRGTGIDGAHDGILHRNVLACYTHQRDTGNHHWTWQ